MKDEFSKSWFKKTFFKPWEPETFEILEFYKNSKKTYIDIGSWIGPTVLYSSEIYDKVLAIEPDPVALKRLKKNIAANNFRNITLVEKALGRKKGIIKFGGRGELGNSCSTILVNDSEFLKGKGVIKITDILLMWKLQH